MATQTSLVAQQVRLQQWAEQIRDCQSRPKGMDVETWCARNNQSSAGNIRIIMRRYMGNGKKKRKYVRFLIANTKKVCYTMFVI